MYIATMISALIIGQAKLIASFPFQDFQNTYDCGRSLFIIHYII